MPSKLLSIISLAVFLSNASFGQDIRVDQENSYALFTESLENSKDIRYQDILARYEAYIAANPDDIDVKIYRCKFMGSAYYDDYEDYDLNYEETQKCIDSLYKSYPDHPEVGLYRLENIYLFERGPFLDSLLYSYESTRSSWDYGQTSRLFEIAANYYDEDNDMRALNYAQRAERFSDSLDMSVLIAKIQMRQNNMEAAKETLLSGLHYKAEPWDQNEKGNLLIELGEYDKALEVFEELSKTDSVYVDNESLHEIFLKIDKPELARNYLVKDTVSEWNRARGLQKLLAHDLSHSDAETALATYRRVQEENYYDDFLGYKRLGIFLKAPFESWTFNELSHILVFILCLVLIAALPYLWVLPVYALGNYLRRKPLKFKPKIAADWNLKHFWLISICYLLIQFILISVFFYQDYIDLFLSDTTIYEDDLASDDERTVAKSLIISSILFIASVLIFLNKKRIGFVFRSNISLPRMLLIGVLFVVVNGVILKILGRFIDLQEAPTYMAKFLSIKEELTMVIQQYGFSATFFIAVIAAPFAEEIVFRGIILSSTEKRIGFHAANAFQATLFALIHMNLKLFIFYFIFGLATGIAVRKTGGLLTGITMHAVNNLIVILLLYYLTTLAYPFPNM